MTSKIIICITSTTSVEKYYTRKGEKVNAQKLKGKIVEHCGTCENFANHLGLSACSVSLKVKGKRQFKANEIAKAIEVLHLTGEDVADIFFN